MDLEDKFLAKCVRSLSSSVQSTPEKNGQSDDASRSPELLQEFLKSGPRKGFLRSCIDKEKRHSASSKCKMTQTLNNNKSCKNKDPVKLLSSSEKHSSSTKHQRKAENPVRVSPVMDHSSDFGDSNSWICKNSACRANLSIDDSFCKRCSCCICHLFDDNKDPSLWLECATESDNEYSCGLSCHIECALQRRKVGVVDLGQFMQLDGSYCCASCGKVSGILGCWRKQLLKAKEARRVDILCHRIFLGCRLLDGTSRFKELHQIATDAKVILETEVGPLDGVSAKMARGIVSRLPIAGDVHELCSLGIEKVDELLANFSNASSKRRENSLPPACEFLFEEVTSSSAMIVLLEPSNSSSDATIMGYKLWYCNSRKETYTKEPICIFPRSQRRVLITNLQPCTEYTFRIVSYTENDDLGHSEVKCFTKSVEIIRMDVNRENQVVEDCSRREKETKKPDAASSSGFKVRDLGKILHLVSEQKKGGFEGFCGTHIENCCERSKMVKHEGVEEGQLPSFSRGLDLNVLSVPDLNEELTPPFETDDDVGSHDIDKNGDDSQIVMYGKKRPAIVNEEAHDCDSILIEGSPFRIANKSGSLDENFEYCVKMIRWLECEGYIKQDFRLKLLTWYSLRSTDQERRVVNTFIQTLIDDPNSLAGQLVDSFSDVISSKRPRNGFC